MQGIEILNKVEIMTSPNWVFIFIILGIVLVIAGTFMLHIQDTVGAILAISGVTVFFVGLICSAYVEEPTGTYEYQVTIDETVSLTEFYEKYEVIDQEGKIWTIKEKQ